MAPVINSIKNVVVLAIGISGTQTNSTIAVATDTPATTSSTEVSQGCIIKAIWVSLDFCGLARSGTLNNAGVYLAKNVGNNLTLPSALTQGSSNEKRFIIKNWHAMIMRNQDGNPPYHWEGWVKIPKKYQRMATDDTWRLSSITTAAVTGHLSPQVIYKWYR